MKVLYVSDNRCRGNFGCRATSTALSQIIGREFEIVGHISGRFTNKKTGPLVVNKRWSQKKYANISKMKHFLAYSEFYSKFFKYFDKEKYFFGKHDFADFDFDNMTDYFINCLPANKHISEFDLRQYDFDIMIVNGEGSFIFATPAWRECIILSWLMSWAMKMGKKVYYLNGMVSDDPNSSHNSDAIKAIRPVLEKCEIMQVRELYSYNYAKKYFPNANIVLKPDALFSWQKLINDNFKIIDGKYFTPFPFEDDQSYFEFNFSKPYILICGSSSSLISRNIKETIDSYSMLGCEIKEKFPNHMVYFIQSCEGDEFLKEVSKKTRIPLIHMETNIIVVGKILANADLFITGRYHPAILASLGGTPCVFMSSNSHKTLSLQHLLEYEKPTEYSCVPNESIIASIIGDSVKKITDLDLRKKIYDRAKILSDEANTIASLIK